MSTATETQSKRERSTLYIAVAVGIGVLMVIGLIFYRSAEATREAEQGRRADRAARGRRRDGTRSRPDRTGARRRRRRDLCRPERLTESGHSPVPAGQRSSRPGARPVIAGQPGREGTAVDHRDLLPRRTGGLQAIRRRLQDRRRGRELTYGSPITHRRPDAPGAGGACRARRPEVGRRPAAVPPEECDRAAQWVLDKFAEVGFTDAHLEETSDGSQAVVGSRPCSGDAPTVLLYAHYDVQPPSTTRHGVRRPSS